MQPAGKPKPPQLVELNRRSPLTAARIRRKLSQEEAAARAGIRPEEVGWLEEGRVYRFPSADDALQACILYASALGIDLREARTLAGLPLPPKQFGVNPLGRLVGVAAIAALLSAIAVAVTFSTLELGAGSSSTTTARRPGPSLPPPWRIQVDVLNGSGDINYTRRIADRITALGYRVRRVAPADRFDYPQTAVYYHPGGQPTAVRLAGQLGVTARPLPAGTDKLRHVVIVGPARVSP